MPSLVQQLRYWLAADSTQYECRSCGTTLQEQRETCPNCGAEDIASYDLD